MMRSGKNSTHSVRVGNTRILVRDPRFARLRDPYHWVLTLSWPAFFLALVGLFICLNLVFGTAYWLLTGSVANAHAGAFLDDFFFSVETLATVGYGTMSPATLGGHIVATTEIFTGMIGLAVITGLVFARFSKPTARILFSRNAIVRNFDGKRCLMLRIANERHNNIVEATTALYLLKIETDQRGESFIRIADLELQRKRTPVFALSWTLIHPIDDQSPLHGLDAAKLAAMRARILLTVTGHDETMAAPVYAKKEYETEEIMFDIGFANILTLSTEGERIINFTRFHDLEPLEAPLDQPGAGRDQTMD